MFVTNFRLKKTLVEIVLLVALVMGNWWVSAQLDYNWLARGTYSFNANQANSIRIVADGGVITPPPSSH